MSDLRMLIEAAKADAPSGAARANVWAGVSSIVGEAATVSSAAGASAAAGTMGGAKMLILGTLLGASVTVGIGAAMLFVGHAPVRPPMASVVAPAAAHGNELVSLAKPALAPSPMPNPEVGQRAAPGHGSHPAAGTAMRAAALESAAAGRRAATAAAAAHANPAVASEAAENDTLAREASSLAEARGALARHDALSALQIVRSLRALPGRQLVPEELAVEAQALRGLGLDDDANAVETRLRARFPDSVLGR